MTCRDATNLKNYVDDIIFPNYSTKFGGSWTMPCEAEAHKVDIKVTVAIIWESLAMQFVGKNNWCTREKRTEKLSQPLIDMFHIQMNHIG